MRILICLSQFGLGGTETYSVTIAEQLERLGHPTRLFAGHSTSAGRELAASRGLSLTVGDPLASGGLDEVDAVIAQDAAAAYALASKGERRQLFVIHGIASFERPPQALEPAPPVVVLNDRIASRAATLAAGHEIVRLRQPIDLERFRPGRPSRPRARRVLVFSNYLGDDRLAIVEQACAESGLELARLGIRSETSVDPGQAILDADIVVGYGRSVLEAMALGRAAYVWDRGGGDGWVTAETYGALEADGFSGAATGAVVDVERMRADFASYRPELGVLGFDLARKHHSASKHAEALVRLLEQAEPPAFNEEQEALALLVRAEARAANRAGQFEVQMGLIAAEAEELRAALAAERETAAGERRQAAAEREGRLAAEGELATLLRSSSWRLTAPLRRAMQRLRAQRDRSSGR
jgi:hypothetical protein